MPHIKTQSLVAAKKAEREAKRLEEEAKDNRPKWKDLTDKQKDDILHEIAVKLGLVKK